MPVYIALLRGINVSGRKKVRMEELRAMATGMGFDRVQTYIQSGNLIFHTPQTEAEEIESRLRQTITATFGFEVPVILRERETMARIVDANPFATEGYDEKHIYISYFDRPAESTQSALLNKYMAPGDRITLHEMHLWFYCPAGYGKSRLTNNTVERLLGLGATTRNLKTTRILREMADATVA